MSVAFGVIRDRQDQLFLHLEQTYPSHRVLRDKIEEPILWLRSPDELVPMIEALRREPATQFDRLSDITAYDNIDHVDGPKRLIVVYQLYSLQHHTRLRLKIAIDQDESVPTLTVVWGAANWLEREVFDMFGIRFAGHPDLRRILMDERFVGHPLLKEYELEARQPFSDSLPVRIATGFESPEESH